MSPKFRFLLVEDNCMTDAKAWVKLNLPGSNICGEAGACSRLTQLDPRSSCPTCSVEFADSLVEAWKRIEESDDFDGLILDMDLYFKPGPDAFTKYIEDSLRHQWRDYAEHVDGDRVDTGGLWLWARASRTERRAAPPTIFFTGHAERFGKFLDPMKWAGMVFWCPKRFERRTEEERSRSQGSRSFSREKELAANWENVLAPFIEAVFGCEYEPSPTEPQGSRQMLLSALIRVALKVPLTGTEKAALEKLLSSPELHLPGSVQSGLLPETEPTRSADATSKDQRDTGVFADFLHSVRSRLFQGQFFPNLAAQVEGSGEGATWPALASTEESPGGWRLASLFPEFDFQSTAKISVADLGFMRNELFQQSQIKALSQIFSEQPRKEQRGGKRKSDLTVCTHYQPKEKSDSMNFGGWNPMRDLEGWNRDVLQPLHEDIRAELETRIDDLQKSKNLNEAWEKAIKLEKFLREPDGQGLYFPENRRREVEKEVARLRSDYTDRRAFAGSFPTWRMGVIGLGTPTGTLDHLRSSIDQHLRERRGTLARLAWACRGFLLPIYWLYVPADTVVWKRHLLDRAGHWQRQDGIMPPGWYKSSLNGFPVEITLDPMLSAV